MLNNGVGQARMSIADTEALVTELVEAADPLYSSASTTTNNERGGIWQAVSSLFAGIQNSAPVSDDHLAQLAREILDLHLAIHLSKRNNDEEDTSAGAELQCQRSLVKTLVVINDSSTTTNSPMLLRFYQDDNESSTCQTPTSIYILRTAAISVLRSSSPGLLEPEIPLSLPSGALEATASCFITFAALPITLCHLLLFAADVISPPPGSWSGGKGPQDLLLMEMQRLWPKWALRLLLSLGGGLSDQEERSLPSLAPKLFPWSLTSWIPYWNYKQQEPVQTQQCVNTELVNPNWRVELLHEEHEEKALTKAPTVTKPRWRRSIARLKWAHEIHEAEEKERLRQAEEDETEKRWNILDLEPASILDNTKEEMDQLSVLVDKFRLPSLR